MFFFIPNFAPKKVNFGHYGDKIIDASKRR